MRTEVIEHALINQVAQSLRVAWQGSAGVSWEEIAAKAIAAVRSCDREQRDKLNAQLATRAADVVTIAKSDPDDYRDLPLAMTNPVTFKGGLTEGKP